MGVDIDHKNDDQMQQTEPKSEDVCLELLIKLYRFLACRTNSDFNNIILKRLLVSKINRPVISLSRIVHFMKRTGKENCIAVVVGTVTDDSKIVEIPRLQICALQVTEKARGRILVNGGEILTFDQLAVIAPIGQRTVLLRGKRTTREANKHFGLTPGVPQSHTKSMVRSKGCKFEKAKGARKGCGCKK